MILPIIDNLFRAGMQGSLGGTTAPHSAAQPSDSSTGNAPHLRINTASIASTTPVTPPVNVSDIEHIQDSPDGTGELPTLVEQFFEEYIGKEGLIGIALGSAAVIAVLIVVCACCAISRKRAMISVMASDEFRKSNFSTQEFKDYCRKHPCEDPRALFEMFKDVASEASYDDADDSDGSRSQISAEELNRQFRDTGDPALDDEMGRLPPLQVVDGEIK